MMRFVEGLRSQIREGTLSEWAASRFPDKQFVVDLRYCLPVQVLVQNLLWGSVPESCVKMSAMVVDLDVSGNVISCFLPCGVDGAMRTFYLHRGVERLSEPVSVS